MFAVAVGMRFLVLTGPGREVESGSIQPACCRHQKSQGLDFIPKPHFPTLGSGPLTSLNLSFLICSLEIIPPTHNRVRATSQASAGKTWNLVQTEGSLAITPGGQRSVENTKEMKL